MGLPKQIAGYRTSTGNVRTFADDKLPLAKEGEFRWSSANATSTYTLNKDIVFDIIHDEKGAEIELKALKGDFITGVITTQKTNSGNRNGIVVTYGKDSYLLHEEYLDLLDGTPDAVQSSTKKVNDAIDSASTVLSTADKIVADTAKTAIDGVSTVVSPSSDAKTWVKNNAQNIGIGLIVIGALVVLF